MATTSSQRAQRRAAREQGESSRGQRKRVPPYDRFLFDGAGAGRWYELNKARKIVSEKKLSGEVEAEFHLEAFFDVYGWSKIFYIGGGYHPEIIREFYANLDTDEANLDSHIRGTDVVITLRDIANFLDMEIVDEGSLLQFTWQGNPEHEANFDFSRAYTALGITRSSERRSIYAKFLQVSHRLLAYFLRFNVLPASGSTNEVRKSDLYLLYHMIARPAEFIRYNLLRSIVSWIKTTRDEETHKRALGFPILIYQCLRVKYPGLLDNMGRLTDVDNVVTMGAIERMGYVRINGVWYHKEFAPPPEEPVVQRRRGRPRQVAQDVAGPSRPPTGYVTQEHFDATIATLFEQRERDAEELRRLRALVERQDPSRHTSTDASVGGSSAASASGAHMDISGARGGDAQEDDD